MLSVFGQHRHPADLAIGQKACTANGDTRFIQGQEVLGVFVQTVPFELAIHALFVDEHGFAQRAQPLALLAPLDVQDVDVH